MPRVVLDTCVLAAAVRSARGASNRLLSLVGTGAFGPALSVPLVFGYEDALLRPGNRGPFTREEIVEILDFISANGVPQEIHFLWRPHLPDSRDDHVLELAVAARCEAIVTFNLRDFRGAEAFGVRVVSPGAFLGEILP